MNIEKLGTPYEQDLKVKDRTPILTPNVGDRVKIKSREWYNKWSDKDGIVRVNLLFTPSMSQYCGLFLEVYENIGSSYIFKEMPQYVFTSQMFEDVFPKVTALKTMKTTPAITLKGIPLSSPFTTLGGPWSLYVDTVSSTQSSTKKKLKMIKPTRLIKIKKL